MALNEALLGSVHRLKGENLQVLAGDIEENLSNASAGLSRSKTHTVLYDGVLNDKVIESLRIAKGGIAEFRLQASQGVRQDRTLAQSLSTEFERVLERLEQEQKAAESLSREAGIIGGDELSRKRACVAALKKASEIQAQSAASVSRSVRIVQQTERVGIDTAVLIRQQTEQLKDIYADTAKLDDGLRTSNRILTQIARRACQDRVTACLFVILIFCIVGALVARMLFKPTGPKPWIPHPSDVAAAATAADAGPANYTVELKW